MLATVRQSQILEWLHDEANLTTDALAGRLGVSIMTVHRDLDALARAGQVVKVHGGVVLPERASKPANLACELCDLSVQARTAFTIQEASGDTLHACCPHCGVLMLLELETVSTALAKDFLYGNTVNAAQAFYVVESGVTVCCVPSTLCFSSRSDATRFQKGFGGTVMVLDEVREYLALNHRHIHSHH